MSEKGCPAADLPGDSNEIGEMMIIDIHTHLFPETIRSYREKLFPGEPAFQLLYTARSSKLVGAESLLETMDEQGIDHSVVFGFPWKSPDTCRMHNDYIMEVVSRYPDRLIGFCCFDPFNSDAARETERCLNSGLSGVGELAFYQSGIMDACLEQLEPIMEICRDRNMPVLIHTNEPVGHYYAGKTDNTLAQIYKLVQKFQNNNLILAHLGGGLFFYALLKKEVRASLKNVYFDTAAVPFLYRRDVYPLAMEIAGRDKILFGSDFPLLKPARYIRELEKAGLVKQDIAAICGLNAARLLGI